MMAFPILSRKPVKTVETIDNDPTIISEPEGGIVRSRPRQTALPRRWEFDYAYMTEEDKESVENLQKETFVGSYPFDFIIPKTAEKVSVRFGEPVKFEGRFEDVDLWSFKIVLREAK